MNTSRFRTLLFGKETVKTFFYKCSNSGRNESTPQTQNIVSWISSKAELEISFLNSLLEMWVWKSDPKIDPATCGRWNMPTICRQYVRWDMGSDRGFVCRKFSWAYSFWGQWCVSGWKYASRYGRDQYVGCVMYESRIHTTHAWNLPQSEWSNFQRNISIDCLWYETWPTLNSGNYFWKRVLFC